MIFFLLYTSFYYSKMEIFCYFFFTFGFFSQIKDMFLEYLCFICYETGIHKILITRSIFYLWSDFISFKFKNKYRSLVEKCLPSKKKQI